MTGSHSMVGLKIVPQIIEEMSPKTRYLSRSYSEFKREDRFPQGLEPAVADSPVTPVHAPSRPFRRLRPTISLPPEREAGHEILDILLCRANSESSNLHHVPSPPCRAGNPLIHDAQFCQRKPSTSSVTISHKSSVSCRGNRRAGSSSSSSLSGTKAFVHIEGFITSQAEPTQGIPTAA